MEYYKPIWSDQSFDRVFYRLLAGFLNAPPVNTGHWQAKKDTPMSNTRELQNVVIDIPIAGSPGSWAGYMKPNLPWAEDHFKERVSGKPLNPPPSHVYWPFNQAGNKDHMDGEKFSHSYPERLWPKTAGRNDRAKATGHGNYGIRYEYGDLGNAVDLLVQEPYTRQCFIPIWYPEDLCAAAVHHQRVPCTLGYHAMLRRGTLSIFYPMRSTDAMRYLVDDLYMAGRLAHWLIDECRKHSHDNSVWHEAKPGTLTMHTVSLHVFENDLPIIKAKLDKKVKVSA